MDTDQLAAVYRCAVVWGSGILMVAVVTWGRWGETSWYRYYYGILKQKNQCWNPDLRNWADCIELLYCFVVPCEAVYSKPAADQLLICHQNWKNSTTPHKVPIGSSRKKWSLAGELPLMNCTVTAVPHWAEVSLCLRFQVSGKWHTTLA